MKIVVRVSNEQATQAESSYTVEITHANENNKIYDVMGQEYSSVTKTITDPVNAAITFNSATLDLSEKQLSINFSGDNSYGDINSYGCQYVLTLSFRSFINSSPVSLV